MARKREKPEDIVLKLRQVECPDKLYQPENGSVALVWLVNNSPSASKAHSCRFSLYPMRVN